MDPDIDLRHYRCEALCHAFCRRAGVDEDQRRRVFDECFREVPKSSDRLWRNPPFTCQKVIFGRRGFAMYRHFRRTWSRAMNRFGLARNPLRHLFGISYCRGEADSLEWLPSAFQRRDSFQPDEEL